MATNHTQTAGGEFPEDPEELLPEESVLSLDEYLAMHAAVGHRTRYEILYRLVHGGDMSPKELEGVIGIDDSTLHYHLNKLVDVGLVEKTPADRAGPRWLVYVLPSDSVRRSNAHKGCRRIDPR